MGELIFPDINDMSAFDATVLYFKNALIMPNEDYDHFSGYAAYELSIQSSFLYIIHEKIQGLLDSKNISYYWELNEKTLNFIINNEIKLLKDIDEDLLNLFRLCLV